MSSLKRQKKSQLSLRSKIRRSIKKKECIESKLLRRPGKVAFKPPFLPRMPSFKNFKKSSYNMFSYRIYNKFRRERYTVHCVMSVGQGETLITCQESNLWFIPYTGQMHSNHWAARDLWWTRPFTVNIYIVFSMKEKNGEVCVFFKGCTVCKRLVVNQAIY